MLPNNEMERSRDHRGPPPCATKSVRSAPANAAGPAAQQVR